ncbi:MAG: HAMP domain-containing histidine kinase [Acidobacteria bacterium]|jgi:nitrogen fixation/metabolism regulation signal transduction histidine kinase|nr:HAMP domain-containing histidine kinase [Acidobacteriota bacterium]
MTILLILISLFGFSAVNAVDSFSHKISTQHRIDEAKEQIFISGETLKIKYYIIYTCIFLFLLISLALLLLIDRIIRPVKEIKRGLEMVSRGILSFRINIASQDEFAFLADKFNEMAERLNITMSELESNRKDLENEVNERTRALNGVNEKLTDAMHELKITQKKIIQAETQKSLTTIVAGFAHEINNPLTGILGALDLMELQGNIAPDLQKKLTVIRRQTFRIKGIIEELNRMNPETDQTKLEVDLVNLLEKLVKITAKKKEYKNIKFIMKLPNQEKIVRGNHAALWQVFEGIIENAVEAIEEKKQEDGEICITVENSTDNTYYIARVIDNGGGFQNIDKAFDPFFTTKSRTQKKGIGLSIAYNVVREHKGKIIIANNENGATLEIYLPIYHFMDENSYKIVNSKP